MFSPSSVGGTFLHSVSMVTVLCAIQWHMFRVNIGDTLSGGSMGPPPGKGVSNTSFPAFW